MSSPKKFQLYFIACQCILLAWCLTWRSEVAATFSASQVYPAGSAPKTSLELNDANCVAVRLDLVSRHGTRFPNKKTIRVFQGVAQKLAGVQQFLPATGPLSFLSSWTPDFSTVEQDQLTPGGQQELYHIAKRFLGRLPTLLGREYYSPANFTFMSTNKDRTLQSASSFSFGMFEGSGHLGASRYQPTAIHAVDIDHDPLLRFFDMCPLYKKVEKKRYVEVDKFLQGPEMKQVTERVNSRLQLPANRQLSGADIAELFKAYAFEVAVLNSTRFSPLFSTEDQEVLEYIRDMNKFYKSGYGHEINWKISCTLMKDVLDGLENAIKAAVGRPDDGKPRQASRAIFRLVSSGYDLFLLLLYSLLNVFLLLRQKEGL